jgi:hypothetical protein
MSKVAARLALWLILSILLPSTLWLHISTKRALDQSSLATGMDFIPSAATIKLIALGYDRLIADLYWLAFVNYIGDIDARVADHSLMADRYLDLVTGLDPMFLQPYWYCAFTVGADAQRPLRAHKIILRGIQANPDNWYLPYIAGLNLYLFGHDEVGASKYFTVASKFSDAPEWMGRQSQILAARIPSTIKEINAWDIIYRTEKSSMVRAKAHGELVRLWSKVYYASPKGPTRDKAQRSLKDLENESRAD